MSEPDPHSAATRLDAWLKRCEDEDVDDALDSLASSVEELHGLATGDRYPGSPGHLQMEADRELYRCQKAIDRIGRVVANRRLEAAS